MCSIQSISHVTVIVTAPVVLQLTAAVTCRSSQAANHADRYTQLCPFSPLPPPNCQVQREGLLHLGLCHPHIIQLYATFEDKSNCYFVLELGGRGDLTVEENSAWVRYQWGLAMESEQQFMVV